MRILGIIVIAIVGGSILFACVAALIVSLAGSSGSPSDAAGYFLMALYPVSYFFAGWVGAKLIRKKQPALGPDGVPKTKSRLWPAGIAVGVVVFIVGGIAYLESTAESGARAFCAAAAAGTARDVVVEAAKGAGEKRLRQIEQDSVTVGLTGLPPYSRHFCTVETKDGKVTSARYSTLD